MTATEFIKQKYPEYNEDFVHTDIEVNGSILEEMLEEYAKQASDLPRTPRSIWLIEQIWFDSMENEIDSAVGYSLFGYVENEEKAKEFCSKGKIYTRKDCWAVGGEVPEYRYKEVKYCC